MEVVFYKCGEKMRENESSGSGSRWCVEDREHMESGGVDVYIFLLSFFSSKGSKLSFLFFRCSILAYGRVRR